MNKLFASAERRGRQTRFARLVIAAAAVVTVLATAGPVSATPTSYSFTTFNESSSTFPGGINDSGQIAGYYGTGTRAVAFVRSASGSFTTFTISGARSGTFASGINDTGTVVGYYATTSSTDYGFVRSPTGVVTTITDPNTSNPPSTIANGINNAGDVVGYYYLYTPGTIGDFGFLLNATTGSFTNIVDPAAIGTFAQGINNLGEIVGYYDDDDYNTIGFIRDASGNYIDIADPNAPDSTYAEGVNDAGDIVGYYINGKGLDVGFLRMPDGTYTDITDPSATKGQGTMVTGINDAGAIVGSYGTVLTEHGFVATPVAVPEPGSLPLFAGAMVTLFLFTRRRKRV